jgi:hypothetical protein
MRLVDLYLLSQSDAPSSRQARELLDQTHWFTVNAVFDPRTGEALPQSLSAFLTKVAWPPTAVTLHDRLWRITDHARLSVERLFRALNESPRREHALLPVRAVRELDSNSFIKLSNRPGRNIREKLGSKPYLQAVRRYQSVNLPENRLLKAFVIRLVELLELRRNVLGEAEDDLIPQIRSWLRGEQAQAIARWENVPPNNALLAHRDYRRIWDSWRRLQTLDNDIARDLSHLDVRQKTLTKWKDFGRMYREGAHLFAEMPVLFDYENFTIRVWLPEPLIEKAARKCVRSRDRRTVAVPACVDLAAMRPRFATTESGSEVLTDTYLWQQWKSDTETISITLFDSDAAYLRPDEVTISSHDLFFGDDKTSDCWDRAARAFAGRLRETFKHQKLIWLVPDAVNDFELETIRRNLNARFPGAEPLPRSVAAVFDQVDPARVTSDKYTVLVIDTLGGTTCGTRLIARFDADLKKRLPETKGFYWERCPPIVIPENEGSLTRTFDIVTVDSDGRWRGRVAPTLPPVTDAVRLSAEARFGSFSFCINLTESPVVGGMRLLGLQERAEGIPLWRDQIPELSVKLKKDGLYQRFYLVSRGNTIRPLRGVPVQVPIAQHFTLPAGKAYYHLPLFQGENAAQIGFSIRLDSPKFPLEADTECELVLTFQYGDDEPYNLVFTPLDQSFPPVRATWKRTEEDIVSDAPAPEYPPPLTWADLTQMPKPDSAETSDLLEWVESATCRLKRELPIAPLPRSVGELVEDWRENAEGLHYAFAKCEGASKVYLKDTSFVEGVSYLNFRKGDRLSFELQQRNGKFFGFKVSFPDYNEEKLFLSFEGNRLSELIKIIRKGIYFPLIQVWRDGRSIKDIECPKTFTTVAAERIAFLTDLARQENLPELVRREFLFLLACVHKDTSDECVAWVYSQVESGQIIDPQAVGFALGDVSEEWQIYIFDHLTSNPFSAISVFAYAVWRDRRPVERFSLSELRALLDALLQRMKKICPIQAPTNEKNEWRKWARTTAEPLELLLGLLRTRASPDPEISMLLQPHQKITKHFADEIERINRIIAKFRIPLFSRVQIAIQKPEKIRTPDLIYALLLYLTGDDGANAIHITGVSDSDDN